MLALLANKYVLTSIAAILAGLLCWGWGWETASHACAVREAARVASIRQKEADDALAAKQQTDRLKAELAAAQSSTRIITREIVKHVPDSAACDLGPDVLRLLQNSRVRSLQAGAGSP